MMRQYIDIIEALNEASNLRFELSTAEQMVRQFYQADHGPVDVEINGANQVAVTDVKRAGIGKDAMNQLCMLADHYRVVLTLRIGDYSRAYDRLLQWYSRFGFAPKGDMLVRMPQRAATRF